MHGTTAPLPDGPFSVRLDAAIRRRGLPLARICSHLRAGGIRCTPSTLSLWRHDRTRPVRTDSLRAVRALEQILDTPACYLIGDSDPRPSPSAPRAWWPADPDARAQHHSQEFAQVAHELGIDNIASLENVVVTHLARYDANRCYTGSEISWVVRAVRDGVDRMLVSVFPTQPLDEAVRYERRIEPLLGARAGRRRVFEESGLVVVEMLLERALRRGEATTFTCAVTPHPNPEPPLGGWAREELHSGRPMGMIVVGARFHPHARPRSARTIVRTVDAAGEDARIVEPVPVADGGLLVRAVSHVSRGGAAIEWSWDEP